MRTTIILFCMMLCLMSCRDNKENTDNELDENQIENIESSDEIGGSSQDQPIDRNTNTGDPDTSDSDSEEEANTGNSIAGKYIRSDHPEDWNCSCFCIDVKTTGTSELCLSKDKLYINGRFEQSGNNINIYYSGKSSKTTDSEIPWDKFEKSTPIAVLSPSGNGFDLDWKGFSIDGKIAVDYALYGKKTLEGTYKKK
ncbi:hypothetical protein NE848_00925 [Gramella jeungdoensis]|uniref:Lipoprotein n=1 Tax=Gramella jeungdoensis TaxID=708091 RepID=A0ABT0YWV3_9FLAO|nr:hypothetical protein [Gramella jeungdoensis]MCM8567926.1 hypothetical protein [Gramella jeungdoensis]